MIAWYKLPMPSFRVETPQRCYSAIVERGAIREAAKHVPAKAGKVFVVSTPDVWQHQGANLSKGLEGVAYETLFLPGGEERKRLAPLETLAEDMVRRGGDRSSVVIAFGGGIVNDMAGFLAAIFMRGIPVVQIPTTLLAQVDASIGGKTGVNLVSGKNLIGSFHQPLAVVIDPAVLDTLSDREYRAGLYEIVKAGIIRDTDLFAYLAERTGHLSAEDSVEILELVDRYGPIPPVDGITPENLLARLVHDKKTVQGNVHFVVPVRIGEVTVVSGVDPQVVDDAIRSALA